MEHLLVCVRARSCSRWDSSFVLVSTLRILSPFFLLSLLLLFFFFFFFFLCFCFFLFLLLFFFFFFCVLLFFCFVLWWLGGSGDLCDCPRRVHNGQCVQ